MTRSLLATAMGILAALTTITPGVGHAQSSAIDRGSILIDGHASFETTWRLVNGERTDTRSTHFELTPGLQYFIAPGLAVGGEVAVWRGTFTGGPTSTYLGVGPAVTYYFGEPGRPLHPYIGGAVFIGRNKTDYPDGSPSRPYTDATYRAAGGLLYLLSTSVGVTTELYYRAFRERRDGPIEQDTLGLAVGVAAFVF